MIEKIVEFFNNVQTDLNTDYVFRSCCISAVFAAFFFSVIIVLAIKNKQSRIFGIVTSFLQIAGCMSTTWLVVSFNRAELYNFLYELTLDDPNLSKFIIDILGVGVFRMFLSTIPTFTAAIFCLLGWLSAFFYFNKIKPECSRRISNVAVVLHILKLILVSPIPFFFAFKEGGLTQSLQEQYDIIYYAISSLPFITIFISNMIGNKDKINDFYGDSDFDNYPPFEHESDTDVVVTVEGIEYINEVK